MGMRDATTRGGDHAVVFLVGMPRSGTTLLVERLSKHPDIAATPETHFFRCVCRRPSIARRKLSAHEAEAAYRDVASRLRLAQTAPPETWRTPSLGSTATLACCARAAFADLLAETGKCVLIEKTPDHGFFTDAIATVFPQARFIHIIRDPRDVALSWMKVPWNHAGLLWPAIRWRAMTRRLSRRTSLGGADTVLVRYEDLLGDPGGMTAGVLEFLGLDPAGSSEGAGAAATFDPKAEHWKARAAQPLDPTNSGRWRTEMSPAHQYLFDRLLGRQLDRYGYRRAGITLGDAGPLAVLRAIGHDSCLMARRIPLAIARRMGLTRPPALTGA